MHSSEGREGKKEYVVAWETTKGGVSEGIVMHSNEGRKVIESIKVHRSGGGRGRREDGCI